MNVRYGQGQTNDSVVRRATSSLKFGRRRHRSQIGADIAALSELLFATEALPDLRHDLIADAVG